MGKGWLWKSRAIKRQGGGACNHSVSDTSAPVGAPRGRWEVWSAEGGTSATQGREGPCTLGWGQRCIDAAPLLSSVT